MRWYLESPNRPDELRAALVARYPDLHFVLEGEKGWIRGSFPVVHEGQEIDRFQIEVSIPEKFPREIPIAYEKTHRVPIDPNWHVFNGGGLCTVVPEEWLLNPKSKSVIAYLDGPLRNYFINHALAEAKQSRAMGERAHGPAGLLEAYGEMVGTTEAKPILRYLEYCAAKKVKRHWPCPCGSSKRVVDCHFEKVKDLRTKIPRWVAASALKRFEFHSAPLKLNPRTSTTQNAASA